MTFGDDILQHYNYLIKFALKLTNNKSDAEDLAHTTILKALEKQHLFKEGSNLQYWLGTIQYNTFVTKHRKDRKFHIKGDNELLLKYIRIDPNQEKHIELKNILTANNKLTKKHRIVILLYYIKGYTQEEIAKLLNISPGTVRSRLYRARQALNAYI